MATRLAKGEELCKFAYLFQVTTPNLWQAKRKRTCCLARNTGSYLIP
jgi:hypothetical protein